MNTIKRARLSNLRMVAGGEKRISKVVLDDEVMEWVGIGWIPIRKATKSDRETYPTVVD